MNKKCARCEKTVYPIEELKCLDKVNFHCISNFFRLFMMFLLYKSCQLSKYLPTFILFYLGLAQTVFQMSILWHDIKHEKLQRI